MIFELRACFLLSLVALLSGGCASSRHSNAAIDYVPQRATIVRESALPKLEEVRAASAKADIQAIKAADAVDRALQDGRSIKTTGVAVTNELATLFKKNSVYALELSGLLDKLREQDAFADQAILNISAAKESLIVERELRQQAQQDLSTVQRQVSEKEDEASRLREQLSQEQAAALSLRATAEKNASLANINADKAAASRGAGSLKSKLIAGLAVLALAEMFVIIGLARFKFLP